MKTIRYTLIPTKDRTVWKFTTPPHFHPPITFSVHLLLLYSLWPPTPGTSSPVPAPACPSLEFSRRRSQPLVARPCLNPRGGLFSARIRRGARGPTPASGQPKMEQRRHSQSKSYDVFRLYQFIDDVLWCQKQFILYKSFRKKIRHLSNKEFIHVSC